MQQLEKIEREAENLTIEEQLELVEKLLYNIRKSDITIKAKLNWQELYGTGREIWKEDAQKFVNTLRGRG